MLLRHKIFGVATFVVASSILAYAVCNSNKMVTLPSRVDISSINLPMKEGVFAAPDNAEVTVELKHASTDTERNRGLMFIGKMPINSGMLFTWTDVRKRTFWLKNTPLPLDILFIKKGVIVAIEQGEPYSLDPIGSVDADAVVELNRGAAEHFGIQVGMAFEYADFIKKPAN